MVQDSQQPPPAFQESHVDADGTRIRYLEAAPHQPAGAVVMVGSMTNSNLSFVYDTGHVITAERPEAPINAVSDYVERRETLVVGRGSSIINP
jgi:hypothetical protein